MNMTPLQLWKADERNRTDWSNVVSSPQFVMAATTAFVSYAMEAAYAEDGAAKLRGAKEFLELLKTMGDVQTPRKPPSFGLTT